MRNIDTDDSPFAEESGNGVRCGFVTSLLAAFKRNFTYRPFSFPSFYYTSRAIAREMHLPRESGELRYIKERKVLPSF